MNKSILAAAFLATICTSCFSQREHSPENLTKLGEVCWEESAVPLRPGIPGEKPFWNIYAERFIYAPAFDFKKIKGAEKYRYEILSEKDSSLHTFESDVPYAPLSPVWLDVPVGYFDIKVVGLSGSGEVVGVAGEGEYHRAAPFNGPYLEPVMSYAESGRIALDKIMEKRYVRYWLDHHTPDTSYVFYQHPAKVLGSLVFGAVLHARVHEGTPKATESIKLARIVANHLIKTSFAKGSYLEYFPPSYVAAAARRQKHMNTRNYMSIAGAESGHAYLNLYDYTKDEKYLLAARRILDTYLKTQLPNGTWYLYLDPITGKPTSEQFAIPTSTVNYFERLKNDYGVKDLEEPIERAFNWIMENPVKTYYWTAQYEDIPLAGRPDYKRMSREQPCDLAIYLFKKYPDNPEYMRIAEDMIRFSEDQFITWEQMPDLVMAGGMQRPPYGKKRAPGYYTKNWMLPVVHEQYVFWMPSGRNTALMVETYWHAYVATGKEVYLAKAKSIANNFTVVQQEHDGDYPTFFTKYKMNFWINNAIYPAGVMMEFEKNLKNL